jgi:hypothetical protein
MESLKIMEAVQMELTEEDRNFRRGRVKVAQRRNLIIVYHLDLL